MQVSAEACSCTSHGLVLMRHWAIADRQTERYLSILLQFEAVVVKVWTTRENRPGNTSLSSRASSRSASRDVYQTERGSSAGASRSDASRFHADDPSDIFDQRWDAPLDSIDMARRLSVNEDPRARAHHEPGYQVAEGLSSWVSSLALSNSSCPVGLCTTSREDQGHCGRDAMDFGMEACLFGLQRTPAESTVASNSALENSLPVLESPRMSWPFYQAEPER